MAALTPEQQRTRERVELVIKLVAPALNAVLAVGDRISRIAEPEDHEYYPVLPIGEREIPVTSEGSPTAGPLNRTSSS